MPVEIEVDVADAEPATVKQLADSLEGRASFAIADPAALHGTGRFALVFEDDDQAAARAVAQAAIDQLGGAGSSFTIV